VVLCDSPYSVAEGSDAIVVITEWNEVKHLDLARIKKLMRQAVIIDGRNIYDPASVMEMGFVYHGVGRSIDQKAARIIPPVGAQGSRRAAQRRA